MARQGNTTAVGLGYTQHQKPRAQALAALIDGTPCPRCGRGMYRWMITWVDGRPTSRWLDYDHVVPRALGGNGPRRLVHRRCNRRAGAILGNRMRRGKARAKAARYNRW